MTASPFKLPIFTPQLAQVHAGSSLNLPQNGFTRLSQRHKNDGNFKLCLVESNHISKGCLKEVLISSCGIISSSLRL